MGRKERRYCKALSHIKLVAPGKNVIERTRQYQSDARDSVGRQIALAAVRLVNLLNSAFP